MPSHWRGGGGHRKVKVHVHKSLTQKLPLVFVSLQLLLEIRLLDAFKYSSTVKHRKPSVVP